VTVGKSAVLIVDDDRAVRSLLAAALKAEGHDVLEASDGKEALAVLTSGEHPEPGAIVLDLNMPVMSGWEFLTIVKSYHRLARIPVLVISGGQVHSAALEHGAIAGWLMKPFGAPELVARVTEIAAQHC
jgi:DNA-binding response OmpR family regulator